MVSLDAVPKDVATKSDIEKLRSESREEISRLGQRIDRLEERATRLEERVGGLEKRFDVMLELMPALNTPILVTVIGILLKIILAP